MWGIVFFKILAILYVGPESRVKGIFAEIKPVL